VILWVDEATGTLARVIEVNALAEAAGPGHGPHFIRETIYRHDFTRGRNVIHFDLDDGWNEALPGIAATARFVGVSELLVAAGVSAQDGGEGAAPGEPGFGPSRRNTPGGLAGGGSGAGAGAADQPDVSGQMASIVMVEGDDGVGTGFVARLRGIDFVVTNLHVIGGNERVRVTTVGGKEIPVAGMFGAYGRDIAILRIQGENTIPPLNMAEDPLKTVKLGDQVTVVGNRRGGGVATRVTGTVRGIGPNRVEVDAPFEPGNSGSPILHTGTGEVIGVASFSQTRELDELDVPTMTQGRPAAGATKQMEQRWFGFRMDGVEKWEGIDLAKWRAQAERVSTFEADSEAIYYAMNGRFKEAAVNPRVRPLIERFIERYERMGSSQIVVGQEIQEFFHGLRSLAGTGVRELNTGEYYDFFRTSEYWETSIPQQLRARADLAKRLEKASENSALFLSRLRR
jgi:serine protease Do